MAVNLIDPNAVNNSNTINGSPVYEDMHIFAKLTAVGRDRTIITINGNSESIVTEHGKTEGVNFLGANSEYNFTTDWYDGSTVNNNQEAFGITSIKTVINSSFIPQVNIKFVDVRGLSFFNNDDSPYRMMFDFPPPIFNLTIKGYYGKALTYQLHLVKYTSEFQSDSGNFVIDADFVALTYAPLSDVLLQYTAHFPMMNPDAVLTGDVNKEPINTLDLIVKTRRLYTKLPEKIKNSVENINFTEASRRIDICYEANEFLSNYVIDDVLTGVGSPKLYTYKESNPTSTIKTLVPINKISNFNRYSTVDNHFLIGYETGSSGGTTNFNIPNYQDFKNNTYAMKNALLVYGNKLANVVDLSGASKDINLVGMPVVLQAQSIEYPNTPKVVEFACLDITKAYKQLTNNFTVNRNKKELAKTALNKSINNIVYSFLGMEPTIYNVFKIILNDVDVFFNEIRKTAYNAQGIYSGADAVSLMGDNAGISKREKSGKIIFPFPQIIKNNERATPQMYEGSSSIEFPELDLIDRYISTYLKVTKQMKKMVSKENLSEDGNNTWIPFTSADSSLPANSSSENPYASSSIDVLFSTLLKRYYILSQNVLKNEMLNDPKYVDLYAKSEAINACDAITDALFTSQMQTASDNYSVNINNFFDKISKNAELNSLFTLTQNYAGLDDIEFNGHHFVTSRMKDTVYDGFEIIESNASLEPRKETANGVDPITLFIKDAETHIWERIWKKKSNTESGKYIYTVDNLLLVKDTNGDSEDETKFIKSSSSDIEFLTIEDDTLNMNLVDDLLINGNILYGDSQISKSKAESLNIHTDFYRTWSNILSLKGDIIVSNVNISDDVKALMYLSNFGNTCGMFNKYRNYLNDYVFSRTSIIEMPKFVSAYIGAILTISKSQTLIDELKSLYADQTMAGNLIFADIHDCVAYLNTTSKSKFETKYTNFKTSDFGKLNTDIMQIVSNIQTQNIDNTYDLNDAYYRKMTSDKNKFACLMDREYFLNFDEITFKMTDFSTDQPAYKSISSLQSGTSAQFVNSFFKTFFIKMADILVSRKKEIVSEDAQFKSMANDSDIVNQMYYSFKNINDKWISGLPAKIDGGYPFNFKSGKLIDMFAFVDRNMSPIGDTIINPQVLVDLFDNDETTIFTVLSTLLSVNGFEFFPLQNFMVANDKTNWEDCFKISNTTIQPSSPTYICMYVGGSSNYLTNNRNYANDGIDDMEKDFYPSSNLNLNSYPNSDMMNNNKSINWNNVNGFKVRFGAQNQSMFKDIKIDSKEFPETNESLQILAKLAGDNTKIAPVPKSQSLYNLYENRAYKATVSGLGNVMIQPTQYFQLENVPMYNGVYLILGVEHNITENSMTTEFNGTKILKYPIPRVTQSSTAFGYGGGDSEETAVGLGKDNVGGNGTPPANSSDLLSGEKSNYQSLYTFKIGNGFVPLMPKGEAYIRSICSQHGNSSFTGKGNPLYVGDPHPNVTWVANPTYTKRTYDVSGNVELSSSVINMTTGNIADALISMYNYYAKQYSLDANVIAAQQFRESAYKLWVYNTYEGNLNAMGLPQFLRGTVTEMIINNSYNVYPKFTNAEIAKITNGLSNPHNLYAVDEDKRVILQNVMDNPEIMIKAQCRYMKAISEKCNNVTASTIFSYYLGPAVSAPTYADTTRKAQSVASVNKDNIPKAISYVASIFRDLNKNFFEPNVLKLNEIADAHQSNQA